jgi:hypothetical protein
MVIMVMMMVDCFHLFREFSRGAEPSQQPPHCIPLVPLHLLIPHLDTWKHTHVHTTHTHTRDEKNEG